MVDCRFLFDQPLLQGSFEDGVRVLLVGSSLTGFGIESSDADFCLLVSTGEIDQATLAGDILHRVMHHLSRAPPELGKCSFAFHS
jgi:hypothetical protein